jgi:hypothetical protein
MLGLIEKDLRLTIQRKQTVAIFVVMALVLGISGSGTFAVAYLTILAGIVATGTLSYDEFDNGLEFLMTLPIDRKTYIREKYLFTTAACTIGWCISLVLYVVCENFRGTNVNLLEQLPVLFIILPGMVVVSTIILPLQLKFGTEKGRIVLFAVVGCLSVAIVAVKNMFVSTTDALSFIDSMQGISVGTVIIVFLAICVLIGFISYFCSIRIMQKKEL